MQFALLLVSHASDIIMPITLLHMTFLLGVALQPIFFLALERYSSKLLMIYAAIRFTAGSDNRLHYGNVHGCGCVYSNWCLISEVHFDYFSTYLSTVTFHTFQFPLFSFVFFGGNPNVLPNMCTVLLQILGIFAIIWSHSYNFIL